MRRVAPLLALALLAVQPAAHAGPAGDALSTCFADSTSGKDRKELAKWLFVAISVHPEMHDLSVVTPAIREQADRGVASLVTRLLTVDCLAQTREAASREGGTAVYTAFSSLGQLAMKELMANPDVAASVAGYGKYLDQKKLGSLLAEPEAKK